MAAAVRGPLLTRQANLPFRRNASRRMSSSCWRICACSWAGVSPQEMFSHPGSSSEAAAYASSSLNRRILLDHASSAAISGCGCRDAAICSAVSIPPSQVTTWVTCDRRPFSFSASNFFFRSARFTCASSLPCGAKTMKTVDWELALILILHVVFRHLQNAKRTAKPSKKLQGCQAPCCF